MRDTIRDLPAVISWRWIAQLLTFTFAFHVTPTFGATDGSVGPTSTGSLSISLHVPKQIRLSNLADVALTNATNGLRPQAQTLGCVYQTANHRYQITGMGSGKGKSFTLTNGSRALGYSVNFGDGQVQMPLTAGEVTQATAFARQTTADCGAGGSAVGVGIALDSVTEEPYTGTLTLVMAPD